MELAKERQKTMKSLDIYRLLAMLLVAWGHLAGTGMYAYEIPGIIQGRMDAPIMEMDGNVLGGFEFFLYYKLNTQMAVLGVTMSFICTGYLVTGMLRRYSRLEFLINRGLRVFPLLWVSILLIGVVVFFSQGIRFEPGQYFVSAFLLWQPLKIPAMVGILWTLLIEVLFYLITAAAGKINKGFIITVYAGIALCGLLYREFPTLGLSNLLYDMKYMGFTLLGASVRLAEEEQGSLLERYWMPVACLLLNLIIFQSVRSLFGDETTYPNFFTHFIPTALFLALLGLERRFLWLFRRIPSFVYSFSKLVYPMYLTHVCVGLTAMYWLSRAGINRYVVFAGGGGYGMRRGLAPSYQHRGENRPMVKKRHRGAEK